MVVYVNDIDFSSIRSVETENRKISLDIARFDKVHPIISGNKLFKLKGFIKRVKEEKKTGIITVGGAYSNHLAATAHLCKSINVSSVGIVRGEKPEKLSHTLIQCENDGMKLIYVSREVFSELSTTSEMARYYLEVLNYLFVPEGGHDAIGALGAASMYDLMQETQPTHIILPVGTGTTLAGILASATPDIEVIAIPVLKGLNDMIERIKSISPKANLSRLSIWEDYHFGGYAKKTPELIDFMNQFYKDYLIPTDFVYTAKMMFGVMKKIKSGYFPAHSRIRCMHTGGLQGNLSLANGTLCF